MTFQLLQAGVKRAAHLWTLVETPLSAKDDRVHIHDLASRLGLPVDGSGFVSQIEAFSRHNAIGEGEFGNAIRGPVGVHGGAGRRFWFYSDDDILEADIAYLTHLRKLAAEETAQIHCRYGDSARVVNYQGC